MRQFACTIKPKTETITKTVMPEKRIIVLDVFGTPLEGVHVIGSVHNTITDGKGEAIIQSHGSEEITFSHVGKVTEKIAFSQLSNVVILKDAIEDLEEVIISAVKPKKDNLWIWILGLSAGGLYLWSKNKKKQPRTVNL
ncbi:hypothetical protein U6A24_12620 [Aquimarina gracilis]|uniref:Uncharacterized protein n=1 Tax=Aquimarina gracilis TaxID=874422 RepID=A0ABU5ZWR5_9FLAO|nr:hypothetical protein [Aquimarina gracilis]MEB3346313.1 hypothetical protein [Aquimarina gracilis]